MKIKMVDLQKFLLKLLLTVLYFKFAFRNTRMKFASVQEKHFVKYKFYLSHSM